MHNNIPNVFNDTPHHDPPRYDINMNNQGQVKIEGWDDEELGSFVDEAREIANDSNSQTYQNFGELHDIHLNDNVHSDELYINQISENLPPLETIIKQSTPDIVEHDTKTNESNTDMKQLQNQDNVTNEINKDTYQIVPNTSNYSHRHPIPDRFSDDNDSLVSDASLYIPMHSKQTQDSNVLQSKRTMHAANEFINSRECIDMPTKFYQPYTNNLNNSTLAYKEPDGQPSLYASQGRRRSRYQRYFPDSREGSVAASVRANESITYNTDVEFDNRSMAGGRRNKYHRSPKREWVDDREYYHGKDEFRSYGRDGRRDSDMYSRRGGANDDYYGEGGRDSRCNQTRRVRPEETYTDVENNYFNTSFASSRKPYYPPDDRAYAYGIDRRKNNKAPTNNFYYDNKNNRYYHDGDNNYINSSGKQYYPTQQHFNNSQAHYQNEYRKPNDVRGNNRPPFDAIYLRSSGHNENYERNYRNDQNRYFDNPNDKQRRNPSYYNRQDSFSSSSHVTNSQKAQNSKEKPQAGINITSSNSNIPSQPKAQDQGPYYKPIGEKKGSKEGRKQKQTADVSQQNMNMTTNPAFMGMPPFMMGGMGGSVANMTSSNLSSNPNNPQEYWKQYQAMTQTYYANYYKMIAANYPQALNYYFPNGFNPLENVKETLEEESETGSSSDSQSLSSEVSEGDEICKEPHFYPRRHACARFLGGNSSMLIILTHNLPTHILSTPAKEISNINEDKKSMDLQNDTLLEDTLEQNVEKNCPVETDQLLHIKMEGPSMLNDSQIPEKTDITLLTDQKEYKLDLNDDAYTDANEIKPPLLFKYDETKIVQTLRLMPLLKIRKDIPEQYSSFPGPLTKTNTHKDVIIRYFENIIEKLIGEMKQSQADSDVLDSNATDKNTKHISKILLLQYLCMAVKQNGAIVGADISKLLINNPVTPNFMLRKTDPTIGVVHKGEKLMDIAASQNIDVPIKNEFNEENVKNTIELEQSETKSGFSTQNKLVKANNLSIKDDNRFSIVKCLSPHQPIDFAKQFQTLLLAGQQKEAYEWCVKNNAWGPAFYMAFQGADKGTINNLLTRFLGTLSGRDPILTFFQNLSAKEPSYLNRVQLTPSTTLTHLTDDGLPEWYGHLAMMLANPTNNSVKQRKNIEVLGSALAQAGDLNASHFCYIIAQIPLGNYNDPKGLYTLITSNKGDQFSKFCCLDAIYITELWEYVVQLEVVSSPPAIQDIINAKQIVPGLYFPTFQPYKFYYLTLLLDMGLVNEAYIYLEIVAKAILQQPMSYKSTFIFNLFEIASSLKWLMEGAFHTLSPLSHMNASPQQYQGSPENYYKAWWSGSNNPIWLNELTKHFQTDWKKWRNALHFEHGSDNQTEILNSQSIQQRKFSETSDNTLNKQSESEMPLNINSVPLFPFCLKNSKINDTPNNSVASNEIGNIETQFQKMQIDTIINKVNQNNDRQTNSYYQQSQSSNNDKYFTPHAINDPDNTTLNTAGNNEMTLVSPQIPMISLMDFNNTGSGGPGSANFNNSSTVATLSTTLTSNLPQKSSHLMGKESSGITSQQNIIASLSSLTNSNVPFNINQESPQMLSNVSSNKQQSYNPNYSSLSNGHPFQFAASVPSQNQPYLNVTQSPQNNQNFNANNAGNTNAFAKSMASNTSSYYLNNVANISNEKSYQQMPQTSKLNNSSSYYDQMASEESVSQQNKSKTENVNGSTNAKTSQNSGGRWFGGIINKILPKGPNEMILPDDSKKTIVWNAEKKRWENSDGTTPEDECIGPPPSDMQLGGNHVIPPMMIYSTPTNFTNTMAQQSPYNYNNTNTNQSNENYQMNNSKSANVGSSFTLGPTMGNNPVTGPRKGRNYVDIFAQNQSSPSSSIISP